MDLNIGPRRENGKIVPRHLLVFHTPEEKVIHLRVEYTVRIGDIYKQIEECVGYAVYLQQTDKKNNTVVLDQDEIAEDGMNFGYSVQVKRRTPKLESYFQTKAVRSWACRLHEIPGVLRAGAPPADGANSAKKTKQAKEPDPPADDKGKQAKEPDPPADEPASDGEPRRTKRHGRFVGVWAPPADDKGKQAKEPEHPPDEAEGDGEPRRTKRHGRPIPAWAPRGVPGATAQLPRKYDEDGNLLPTEYQHVYLHQGM
jgi:hypothetical protein